MERESKRHESFLLVQYIARVGESRRCENNRYGKKDYELYDDFSAEVVITAGTASETVTVTRGQKDALILTQDFYTVPSAGETIDVELQQNIDYEVQIPDTVQWITRVGSKGLSTDVLHLKVDPFDKTDAIRYAFVLVKDKNSDLSAKITVNPPFPTDGIFIRPALTVTGRRS